MQSANPDPAATSDGTSGDVKVTLGAAVTVSGEDAIGILLKSSGLSGNGDLSVTIASGGSVTASGDAETAVNFGVGDDNTLVNDGIDCHRRPVQFLDLRADVERRRRRRDQQPHIQRLGQARRRLLQQLHEQHQRDVEPGILFYLGTDGTLTNEGIVSPGGKGSVLSSSVTGAFTQSSDGTYLVDIDGSSTDALTFETAGTTIAGTVQVNVVTAPSSSGSATIALANSGSIDTSPAVRKRHGHNRLHARHEQFERGQSGLGRQSRRCRCPRLRQRQPVFGRQSPAADPGERRRLGPELSQLLNIVSVEDYLAALDTLASQVSSDGQLTALMSNMQFSDALLSCADYAGAYRFVSQDQCAWLKFGVIRSERDGSSENRPFDQTAAQFAGGAQFQVSEDWHVGGGFSVENQTLTVDDIAESKGTFYQGGVVTKRSFGNTIVSVSLVGRLRQLRHHACPGHARHRHRHRAAVDGVGPAERLACLHAAAGPWYIKPRADLAFDHVVMEGYTEHGAGGASLTFEESAETYVSVQPAVEIGGELNVGKGLLIRPSLSVGLTRFLTDAAPVGAGVFRRHAGGRCAVHHRQRLRQDLCRREGRHRHPHRR